MELDFNWISILVLFGALQGTIFSIILFFNRQHPGARYLALFMLVFAYNGLETFNWVAGLDRYIDFFELFSFILIFAAGPSLYFYVHSLLYPDVRIAPRRILLHYAIVFFQLMYRLVFAALYALWKLYGVKVDFARPMMNLLWMYAEPLSVVMFIGYLVATVRLFKQAGSTPYNTNAISKEGQQLIRKWIKALLICMVVLGIVWPITVFVPYITTIPFGPHYYPIELALVLFIYWIAFAGYYRIKMIYFREQREHNTLSVTQAENYLSQLQEAMETRKLYLDPELTLDKFSERTGIPAKTVSSVLNHHLKSTFNTFVNQYRIREVKKKLLSGDTSHLTISGVALESGFNSQATFQRAFKNLTGITPRQYLNTYKNVEDLQE